MRPPEQSSSPRARTGLSKSKIAIFEQCPKRLWLSAYRPELSHDADSTKLAFRIGHAVGELACELVPDGIMIDADAGLGAAAQATADAMAATDRRPLFEATFIHDGVVVRVDLLLPEADGWHVVEVKSTTSVKPYQRADLATQLWVLRGCGVPVSRASIRVIDRSFVLQTEDDYAGLFADHDTGHIIAPMVDARTDVVADAKTMLAGDEPAITVGPQCSDPFPCSFDAYCRRDLPDPAPWPTSLLPGVAGKALARTLGEGGIDDLLAVDAGDISNAKLSRIHAATVSGVAYHDDAAIRRETDDWAYPRIFLDFETIAFAIPRWLGTSPFQQIPFQFSAHVDRGYQPFEHHEFLSIDGTDPRVRCAAALTRLPATGAVVAWNASFERSCLLQLARTAPAYAPELRSLAERLVDLLPVARRHYYHRDMRGSWSIKAVVPTLAPSLAYDTLDGARSGIEAQDHYLEAITASTSDARRDEISQSLRAYCRHDTLAMVVALDRLRQTSG